MVLSILSIIKNENKCVKCPYKLGMIKTSVNPCPQCKDNGYNMFDIFQKRIYTDKLIFEKTEDKNKS